MPWRPKSPDDFPSLGWQILDWLGDNLPSPRDEGAELLFTNEQALQLVEWFRLDPLSGRRVYRRGYSRRAKGWGKSPVEAAKAIAEFVGPVRFDGWDANGEPVGRPWGFAGDPAPWVQVAAVSEDQTDNTWSVIYTFLTMNDGRAADALRVDAGLTRCFHRDIKAAKMEPVTAAAGSREGQPITYAVLDETHLWTPRNGGVKLARTLRRNIGKMNGHSYETTNSFVPGEGSVAEGSYRSVQRGTAGVFADEVEAPREIDGVPLTEDAPDSVLRAGFAIAYGQSWWVDLDRLVADARDPETPWEDVCRFNLNWNQKAGGAAVDAVRWGELAKPREVAKGTRIGIGFDGSISDDSTFLIGCTEDGYLWTIGRWERPRHDDGRAVRDWVVPRLEVGQAVRAAFDEFDVGRMFGDPPKWATELDTWADEFRLKAAKKEDAERVLQVSTFQHAMFAKMVDRFLTGVRSKHITHGDDSHLSAHILAAHLKRVRTTADEDDHRVLSVFVKPEDGRKIDGAVAAVLAYEAAMTMPEAITYELTGSLMV